MDSRRLIDAQFDRAVEIVQGLPKTGPIQTGYEEKLTMYSLYKQATVGNVESTRPGIWDMLGRAKWDAWAKHKDLDPYEAKWLYVDALLKVLRRYSDKTVARDLVQELESFGGDPSNLILSHTFSRSRGSESSGSTASRKSHSIPGHFPKEHVTPRVAAEADDSSEESSGNESGDEAQRLPGVNELSQPMRSQSSVSLHHYRTPAATARSLMSPPPEHDTIPLMQPLPSFETPSAFGNQPTGPAPPVIRPSSAYSGRYPQHSQIIPVPNIQPAYPNLRPPSESVPSSSFRQTMLPSRPISRSTLEQAVENVQVHLAAITERLGTLEAISYAEPLQTKKLRTSNSLSPKGSGSPMRDGNDELHWDIEDMGLWYLVLNPLGRVINAFKLVGSFITNGENQTPTLVVVRRLFLDISFILTVLAVVKTSWRRSHARRQEVNAALVVLWRAITGSKSGRALTNLYRILGISGFRILLLVLTYIS